MDSTIEVIYQTYFRTVRLIFTFNLTRNHRLFPLKHFYRSPTMKNISCGCSNMSTFLLLFQSDLIFFHFIAEFRFFYSGFYHYDSFFIVYSILLLADFRFFVGFVKSGLFSELTLTKHVDLVQSGHHHHFINIQLVLTMKYM